MSYFKSFSRQARAALVNAQFEAIPRDHTLITPAHLLLGLVRERKGVAAKVLRRLGLPEPALELVLDFGPDEWKQGEAGEIELSDRSKRVLGLAVDEWQARRHQEIGTSHILLGLIREEEQSGTGVLQAIGLEPGDVRDELLAFIASGEVARTVRSRIADWMCGRL